MRVRQLASMLAALRGYRAMLGVFCLYSAAGWIVLAWMPLYLYEKFHMSLLEAGFSATFWFTSRWTSSLKKVSASSEVAK